MQGTPSISSIEDDAVLGRDDVARESFPLFGLDPPFVLGLDLAENTITNHRRSGSKVDSKLRNGKIREGEVDTQIRRKRYHKCHFESMSTLILF